MLQNLFALISNAHSKIKYWGGHPGGQKSAPTKTYQQHEDRNKPGKKRALVLWEEFLLTLVRLRLGIPCFMMVDLFGGRIRHSRLTDFHHQY